KPPQNEYMDAFLLATNGAVFRYLTLELAEETQTNSSNVTNEYQRVGYTPQDLRGRTAATLGSLKQYPTNQTDWGGFGKPINQRTETFVLAWACWQKGLQTEPIDLYRAAKRLPGWRSRGDDTNSFRVSIEKDVAYALIWKAVLGFEDLSVSRPELMARFNAI